MARQPKVDLGSIIQSENVKEIPIPETQTDPKPESKKRSYPSRDGKSRFSSF